MKLKEIAELMVGIVTKRELNEEGENSYSLFSLKSYEENLEYERLITQKDLSNKLIKKGDLLFRFLYPNKIIYVDEKLEGKIVSSHFCIIRTEQEKMNPIVLKWYLESKMAENDLKSIVTGSVMKSITIGNLKTLEIPHIPIKMQKIMEKMISLWDEEKKITQEILEEKEKLYNSYLEEFIKKGERYAKR